MKVQWIKNKLVNEDGRIVGHYHAMEGPDAEFHTYVLDIMKGLDRTAGTYIDEDKARQAIVRQFDAQLEEDLEWTTLTADLSDGFEKKGLKPGRTFDELRESVLNRIKIPDANGNVTAEQGDILIAEHNDNIGPDGKVRGTLAVKHVCISGRSVWRFQPRVLITGNVDGLPFVSTGWMFRRKL